MVDIRKYVGYDTDMNFYDNKLYIVFTDHALERMKERHIDEYIISKLINNIEKIYINIGEEIIYSFNDLDIVEFSWNNNYSLYEMNCLRNINIVGVHETENTFVVITTYFDEKGHNLSKLKNAVSGKYIKSLKNNFNFQDLLKGKECI